MWCSDDLLQLLCCFAHAKFCGTKRIRIICLVETGIRTVSPVPITPGSYALPSFCMQEDLTKIMLQEGLGL